MKKPKAVKQIELLSMSDRKLIASKLDEGVSIGEITNMLRATGSNWVTPDKIAEYAAWREMSGGREMPKKEVAAEAEKLTGHETTYAPDDLLLTDVVDVMGNKVKLLTQEAREDPTSDAAKIVEALLLAQMSSIARKTQEMDMKTIAGLRNDHKEVVRRNEHENSQRQIAEAKLDVVRADLKVKSLRIEAQTKELNAKTKLVETQTKALHAVAKTTDTAQRDAAKGKPWNTAEVVERISKAIGLGGPLVERVEQPSYQ